MKMLLSFSERQLSGLEESKTPELFKENYGKLINGGGRMDYNETTKEHSVIMKSMVCNRVIYKIRIVRFKPSSCNLNIEQCRHRTEQRHLFYMCCPWFGVTLYMYVMPF